MYFMRKQFVFVRLGRIHVTILGDKAAIQKKSKNGPWPRAARPDPEATQDDSKGDQKVENRRAPNAEKQSTRAPEPKFERKNPNENDRFPQMLGNIAREHQKCPQKNH